MFDEDAIRQDLRTTLQIAGSGPLEIIMKDTHTVENQPQRITRWVELALEEVDRYMGAAV
jgi:glycine cleavage system regulatory protein